MTIAIINIIDTRTNTLNNFVYVIPIFGWYICMDYVCLYLEGAAGTVFEVATFPLAQILNYRCIFF